MEEPKQKSLIELLSESEEDDEYICVKCAYAQKKLFKICPNCGERAENPTLEEWGKHLPIGVEQGDSFVREFDLVPLDWKREREVNEHWGNAKGNISLNKYIGAILAESVTHVAGQDITQFKYNKKLLIFSQMYQADIFYMYAYLRKITLGNELNLGQIGCMSCGHQFPYTADLSSLEVVVIDKPSDLVSEIDLKDGFEMGGDHKTHLKVKPPKWSIMGSGFPTNLNGAEMFLKLLTHCVVEIEGIPGDAMALTEREVSQFSKVDVEICENAMEDILAGPRWEIEGNCPKCDATFYDLIDWTYDRFFALSSRSPRRRRRSRRL